MSGLVEVQVTLWLAVSQSVLELSRFKDGILSRVHDWDSLAWPLQVCEYLCVIIYTYAVTVFTFIVPFLRGLSVQALYSSLCQSTRQLSHLVGRPFLS